MRVSRFVMLAAVAMTLARPVDVLAQQTRDGFWFHLGLGWGSLGCDDCDDDRIGGFSGALALGGTLSQKVLLAGSYNLWTKTEDDATLTAGTLTAALRFYPSSTGGFFLQGGLGVGVVNLELGDVIVFRVEETGFGALLGLGYDIRIGRNVSLTPYWNGFAINYSDGDANVGQLGLGITIH